MTKGRDFADVYSIADYRMGESNSVVWPMLSERVQRAVLSELVNIAMEHVPADSGYWLGFNICNDKCVTLWPMSRDAKADVIHTFIQALPDDMVRPNK
jgi:hypothetical protein